MAVLAEFSVFSSRPFTPTRRVAVGPSRLGFDPPPGFGGLLLGGVVAAYVGELDDDMAAELYGLMDDLQAGRRIAQPRLRYRLQVDRIGLSSVTHRLVGAGDELHLDIAADAPPAPQVLAAVYRVGQLDPGPRRTVMDLLRRATAWVGDTGPPLVRFLTDRAGAGRIVSHAVGNPLVWAGDILGVDADDADRRDVQRRFRELLVAAHPDHGGDEYEAAARIEELTEARRILLGAAP